MTSVPREKIAIIGGGMAGLVAAYELSSTPELRARYEVTLYQLGWRLGGKLASGRDPKEGMRNTEHGLHVWFGFYENAFHVFQEVFGRWQKPADCPWKEWDDAFLKQRLTPLGERIGGTIKTWDVLWPLRPGVPGSGEVTLDGWSILMEMFGLLVDQIREGLWPDRDQAHDIDFGVGAIPEAIERLYADTVGEVEAFTSDDPGTAIGAGVERTLGEIIGWLEKWFKAIAADVADVADDHFHSLIHLLHVLKRAAHAAHEKIDDRHDVDSHRLYNIIDVGVAFLCGLLNPQYQIWRYGDLDRINFLEFRQWLIENGGSKTIVEGWSALRAVYDAFFQYAAGDLDKPTYEAGTAARVFLRTVFTYKGSVLRLVKAGMGETVIAPLYQVMLDQGVRFVFFHKLRNVGLDASQKAVAELVFERQAEIKGGAPYRPTFPCKGLVCWPSEPFWEQLVDGDQLKADGVNFESHWCQHRGPDVRLRRGVDFDRVISAIDLSSFKPLNEVDGSSFAEVLKASPRLAELADKLPMIPSVALQLWMRPTLEGLGWTAGRPAMVTWAYPQDVWADMTAVLDVEDWGEVDPPRSLHYLTGVWGAKTDLFARPWTAADTPREALADVTTRTDAQLDQYVGTIWPNAVAPTGGFDRSQVRSSYIRANVDPAECCVGSPTDTARLRPRAHESGIDGLILSGNWVRNGVNSTCVEQATMTGMAAARAISGVPRDIPGEYFLAARPGTPISPSQPNQGAGTTPTGALPTYVSSVGHGEQVMMPPGQVKRGRLYAFAVPADRGQLTTFARRYLSDPTRGALEYTAIAPFVLCTYLRSDFLTSTSEAVGTISDRECALWMVLIEKPRGLALPRLVFWMPYIIIDTSIGMATGREIWGFRKEIGPVSIPSGAEDPARFVGQATIFRTLQTNTRGHQEPLIRVERDTPLGPLERAWETIDDVGIYFAERLLGGAEAWASRWISAVRRFTGGTGWQPHFSPSITTVNLKQFRDVKSPTQACYQSVVSSPLQITKIHGGGPLFGDYWLRITRCESHTIVADLGLRGEESQVAFGGWLDVDMLALSGQELWRAPT